MCDFKVFDFTVYEKTRAPPKIACGFGPEIVVSYLCYYLCKSKETVVHPNDIRRLGKNRVHTHTRPEKLHPDSGSKSWIHTFAILSL